MCWEENLQGLAMTSMEMQHLCHQLGLKPKNQDEKETNDLKREH